MIGTLLGGRYELLELIGTGGMARVYKARCRMLNRYVAVKILKDEYKDDREFVKKFYVESQSAASLSNVNIVSVYDVGEEGGINYIVMELVEGVILKDVIKKNGCLKWDVALNCGLQILSALECAHKNGIVHRDIKPQNIIATYDGVLKVTDFGIAKAVNGNETKKIDESVIGSVHYISPEQAKGIMIDARSDIYSLGIVMYEMLTGKLPFEGENPVSVALMHLNSEPEFIKDVNISVPLELANIVHKAMKRDVAQRYQSAKEMISDLMEFKRKEASITPDFDIESKEYTKILVKSSEEKKEKPVEDAKEEAFHTINTKKTEVKPEVKKEKPVVKKKEKTKQEKIAVYSAAGVAGVIIIVMFFLLINLFFPNLKIGQLFKSKEYYLEDYRGKNIKEVTEELQNVGFEVEVSEGYDEELSEDEIISQRPSGEMNVKVKGTTVYLTVNVEKEDELIKLPSVLGDEVSEAREELENLGFRVKIEEVDSEDVPENHVVEQSPSSGTELKENEQVTLKVSSGENTKAIVPDFIEKTRSEAKTLAEEAGIMVSFSESDEGAENAGKVVSQSVKKDEEIEKGSTVNLVVGREVEVAPKTVTKTFNIELPSGNESEVIIKKDNAEVYRKTHQATEGKVSVNVSGSGTHRIVITVNGTTFLDQNVSFE